MRILVTGCEGQIGRELVRQLDRDHEVLAVDRALIDLRQPDQIRARIDEARPDVVVNAAAYTAVDRAELEPELARQVNATAVGVIGESARALGAAVVHFSTDYVFDGRASRPYTPDDPPNPVSVYGWSKLQGEQALGASRARALIFRTSWVYALRRRNFLMAVLSQARDKGRVRVVNDQIGAPTWCRCVAGAVATVLGEAVSGRRGDRGFGGREGVYHLTCAGSASWFEFAERIIALAGLQPPPEVTPISTAEFGARAARPAYSVLDCRTTRERFGIELPGWEQALVEAMDDSAAVAAICAGQTAGAEP